MAFNLLASLACIIHQEISQSANARKVWRSHGIPRRNLTIRKDLLGMRKIRTWNGVEPENRIHVAVSTDSAAVAVTHGDNTSVSSITVHRATSLTGANTRESLDYMPSESNARYIRCTTLPLVRPFYQTIKFLATITSSGQLDILRNCGTSMFKAASSGCLFDIFPKPGGNSSYVKSVAWFGMDCRVRQSPSHLRSQTMTCKLGSGCQLSWIPFAPNWSTSKFGCVYSGLLI